MKLTANNTMHTRKREHTQQDRTLKMLQIKKQTSICSHQAKLMCGFHSCFSSRIWICISSNVNFSWSLTCSKHIRTKFWICFLHSLTHQKCEFLVIQVWKIHNLRWWQIGLLQTCQNNESMFGLWGNINFKLKAKLSSVFSCFIALNKKFVSFFLWFRALTKSRDTDNSVELLWNILNNKTDFNESCKSLCVKLPMKQSSIVFHHCAGSGSVTASTIVCKWLNKIMWFSIWKNCSKTPFHKPSHRSSHFSQIFNKNCHWTNVRNPIFKHNINSWLFVRMPLFVSNVNLFSPSTMLNAESVSFLLAATKLALNKFIS